MRIKMILPFVLGLSYGILLKLKCGVILCRGHAELQGKGFLVMESFALFCRHPSLTGFLAKV